MNDTRRQAWDDLDVEARVIAASESSPPRPLTPSFLPHTGPRSRFHCWLVRYPDGCYLEAALIQVGLSLVGLSLVGLSLVGLFLDSVESTTACEGKLKESRVSIGIAEICWHVSVIGSTLLQYSTSLLFCDQQRKSVVPEPRL